MVMNSLNNQRNLLKVILSPPPKMIERIRRFFDVLIRSFWLRERASSPQILLEEGYRGFNILNEGGKYYAIHQKEGAFSVRKYEHKKYKLCFSGNTIEELKRFIDHHPFEPIPLLISSYRRFNIISYGDRFYGHSWGEGEFDINRFNRGDYKFCVEGKTIDEVKSLIDQQLSSIK